ncbi:MAG: (deoxy)nucleoside triphosphate pyrophosphohydrolase [Leifsonia sp.]
MTQNPQAAATSAMAPLPLEVVAAVIVDASGRVLACRRSPQKDAAGLWEFPGGKVEPGETPQESLRREIREELGVDIAVGELVDRSVTHVGGRAIALSCFRARLTAEAPTVSTDHDRMRWVAPAGLCGLEWALPDLPAVRILCGAPSFAP